MKIYGPYFRKDGRQHICIVHDDGRKQTKSWPKHLLEKKIGRELIGDETCDHIDGDFTNNNEDNLQILSLSNNILKSIVPAEMYIFICSICNKEAAKPMHYVKHNRKQSKRGPYCSRSCAGKAGIKP